MSRHAVGELFVIELALFVRFGHEGFDHRRRVHAVLDVLAKFLAALLVVPSQADVHAIGPNESRILRVVRVDDHLVGDPVLRNQGLPASAICTSHPSRQPKKSAHLIERIDNDPRPIPKNFPSTGFLTLAPVVQPLITTPSFLEHRFDSLSARSVDLCTFCRCGVL